MIRGLKSLGKASRKGKGALRVSRACLFALAFATLSNTGFAFPHNGRGYSAPRRPGNYAGLTPYARQPAFFAYGRPQRQAAGGARPLAYGPPRNQQARPPYQGNQPRPGSQPRPGNQQPPHLGAWLQRHGNMSPAEQERALQNEPGFDRLPPQTQHQLANRLRQLDNMPPAQRQLTVDRIEALERLSPEAREQVRASSEALRTLPADRQRMVKKAFRDLGSYPPDQRESFMASPQFQRQFTPQERGILSNLLSVEPYEPNAGFRPEYSPPPPPGR